GDEIGAAYQFIQGDHFDPELVRGFFREIRIVSQHTHPEGPSSLGDGGTDTPEPDDPQRLAHQLDAKELRLFPSAGPGGFHRLWNPARERQQHGHCMLGGGYGVTGSGVHHYDTPLCRRSYIYVVDSGARATDDPQIGGLVKQIGGDPRFAANYQRFVASDYSSKLFGVERRLFVNCYAGG